MIGFTPQEFNQVREAISLANFFNAAMCPMLKQRHVNLNKEQRELLRFTPPAVEGAFTLLLQITNREHRDLDTIDTQPPNKVDQIDTVAMRDELENVSALILPDLEYEMRVNLNELPMYNHLASSLDAGYDIPAKLMTWAWEAGRRYGVQQAMAVADSTIDDFKAATNAVLDRVLNGTLDLPPAEATIPPGTVIPFQPITGPVDDASDPLSCDLCHGHHPHGTLCPRPS